MNRDDIIRMAEEAGFGNFEFADDTVFCSDGLGSLTKFAQLVAAHERNEILKHLDGEWYQSQWGVEQYIKGRARK